MKNKNTFKLILAGLAGYFIGFYEMKYKTSQALLKVLCEKEDSDSSDNNKD